MRKTKGKERAKSGLTAFCRSVRNGLVGSYEYSTLLGIREPDATTIIKAVRKGLPFSSLEQLSENVGVSIAEIAAIAGISRRTVARRQQEGSLSSEESDRILRTTRLFAKALELFEGDLHAAIEWLRKPQRALGGVKPLDFAKTEVGAREVEALVERLEHGVFS